MDYHAILKTKIKLMITSDLTIGRNDNIEKVIQMMMDEYSNDNEIELLAYSLLDWIGEYLYDFVDTKNGTNEPMLKGVMQN